MIPTGLFNGLFISPELKNLKIVSKHSAEIHFRVTRNKIQNWDKCHIWSGFIVLEDFCEIIAEMWCEWNLTVDSVDWILFESKSISVCFSESLNVLLLITLWFVINLDNYSEGICRYLYREFTDIESLSLKHSNFLRNEFYC